MWVPRATWIFLVFYVSTMIFSVIGSPGNVNVFSDFKSIDNKTAGIPVHQTDSANVMILKPGRFRLLSDGTVVIEPLNSTEDDVIYEFWSNSSFFCDARETGRNLCGVRWTLSLTSHMISYTGVLLGFSFVGLTFENSVKTSFYGTLLGSSAIFSCNFIILMVNWLLEGIHECEPFGKTVDVFTHLFLLAFAFWMSSIALDSLSKFRNIYGAFSRHIPLRGNFHTLVATLFTRLMLIEIAYFYYDMAVIPDTQLWNSVEKCRMPYLPLYRYYTPIVVVYGIGNFCNLVLFALSFFYFERRATGEDRRLLKFMFVITFIFSLLMIAIWFLSSSTIPSMISESFHCLFAIKTSVLVMFILVLYLGILHIWRLEQIQHGE